MGLGHAFEMNPELKNAFLYEFAQAQLARQIFPNAPLKYMPPTKFKTGNIFRSHIQDALFNIVTVISDQRIHLLGMLTEAIHTPLLADRALAIENARYIATSRGLDVGPQNIVVTPGAKPVLFSALMALVNPGDEVIYPSPGFPIYESLIEWSGAAAVPIRLQEDRQWRFDTDELAALVTDKTRLIILNSPHNPTGGVLTEADMAAIADLARSRDIWILTDEVYSNIVFDGEFVSITRQPGMMDRTIIVEGFSKTYAMTGWRLGYAVCRADLAVHLARIETNVHSCTSAPVQWAGVEALTGPQEAPALMAESFRRRADLITSLLNDIEGVKCQKPGGAFYVMANVSGACQRLELPSAKEFCDKLLLEAGVAILPRTCFGRRLPGEEEYVRFSFATSEELIRAGVQRLKEFVEG